MHQRCNWARRLANMPETALTLEAHLSRVTGFKIDVIGCERVEQGKMVLGLAHTP